MAERYVCATGTWDGSSGAIWGATKDAAAGSAAAPTSGDNVHLDSTAAYTVTVANGAVCKDLTIVAPGSGNFTLAGNGSLSIFGSVSCYASLVRTYTGTITYAATSTGKTIDWGGVSFGGATSAAALFNGSGGGWQLLAALNHLNTAGGNGSITMQNGALDTNGKAVSANQIGNNAGTSSITCGASAFQISKGSSVVLAAFTAACTIDANTSTWTFSYVGSGSLVGSITFANHALYNVVINNTSGYAGFTVGGNFTVSNQFTNNGNNANTQRIQLASTVPGTQRTITVNGSFGTSANVDFEDINIAGSAGSFSGTSFGDCGGNAGITFTAQVTRYLGGSGGNACGTGVWGSISGGTGASFPLPHDIVVIDSNSFSGAGQTLTSNVLNLRLPSLDFTNVTNSPTLALGSNGLFVYGSLILLGIGTLSGTTSGIVTFKGRGNYSLNSNGKTFLAQIDVKAPGGQVGLAAVVTCNFQIRTFQGEFKSNSYDFTCFGLLTNAGSQASADAITLGTSIITLTGTGAVFGTPSANTTVSAADATFKITDTSTTQKNFSCSGSNTTRTYGKIWIAGASTGIVLIDQVGNVQQNFGELLIDSPPRTVRFTGNSSRSYGFTTFNGSGTTGNRNKFEANSSGATYILVKNGGGLVLLNHTEFKDATGNPSGDPNVWYAGDDSVNNGGNTRINFRSLVSYSEGVSETVSITEALSAAMALVFALSESVNNTEQLSAQMGASVGLSDNPVLNENIGASQATAESLSESVTLTEQLLEQISLSETLTEEALLSESLTEAMDAILGVSEDVPVVEELIASMGLAFDLSEDVTLGEFLRAIVDRFRLSGGKVGQLFQASGPGELKQTSGKGEFIQESGKGELKE